MMTITPVSEMTAEELDRAVAVELMGWTLETMPPLRRAKEPQKMWKTGPTPSGAGSCLIALDQFSPSTNPTDDDTILFHVRETWTQDAWGTFADALISMRLQRRPPKVLNPKLLIIYHQTGDYAKAALRVARESE